MRRRSSNLRRNSSQSPFFTRLDDHSSISSVPSSSNTALQSLPSRLSIRGVPESLPCSSVSSLPKSNSDNSSYAALVQGGDAVALHPLSLENGVTDVPPLTVFDDLNDVPEAPEAPAPSCLPHLMCKDQSQLSRATSDPNHQSSFSFLTRRHMSKLSGSVAPAAPSGDLDSDSILSEPCSYSSDAFVASDLWLVQKDVAPAEKELVEKTRMSRRLERIDSLEKSSSMCELSKKGNASKDRHTSDLATGRKTRFDRFDGDEYDSSPVHLRRTRLGEENSNTVLVNQYFTGAVAGHGGQHHSDRDTSSFRADGTTFQRALPERSVKKFGLGFGGKTREDCFSQSMGQMNITGQSIEAAPVEPSGKRRVSRARRLRWWIRRVSHRFRLDNDIY